MVPILSLWVPILVSAVLVFIVSAIIHMVLPYHKDDWKKVEREDDLLEAFRKIGVPPGDYMAPCAGGYRGMKDPAFQEKMKRGPIVIMTVMGAGASMGKSLAQWFVFCVVVGVFAAYLTGRAFGPGTDYMTVFRYAGTTAFLGHSLALVQTSIWYHRAWSTTIKLLLDGLLYALLTAGVFGAMWP